MAGITAAPAWGGAPLSVVATTTDLRSLVEVVGGDRVAVDALVSPGQDPHGVDIKPGQLVALKRAVLLVRVGLDHEPWLARALRTARGPDSLPVDLDCSRGITLLQTETARVRPAGGVHVHGFGNPHYWLDPENARAITAAAVEALARLAPEERARFDANRAAFLARLDAALARWMRAVAPYRGTRVVVAHESWPYFAERFGLVVTAAIEPAPGVPPSPASLAMLTQRMKDTGVRLIIAEPSSNAATVAQVAARTGARAVTLIPSVGGDP